MRETLVWMRARLMGDASGLREKPVRLHIGGIGEWREYDAYPPGPARLEEWYLQPGFGLSRSPAQESLPDGYRYDPADPTPNIGGAMFAFIGAGPVDNTAREARSDVLCYTTMPLEQGLTIIGQTRVTLFARASVPHADFFLRLCDVSPDGISTNITDGLIRATPHTPTDTDGSWRLEFTLHATAYCFSAGHRLRLQVSSGAHPRYARNMGTSEPVGMATRMVPNEIEIFHAPGRESRIALACYVT
jgi:putative CocE/NonD family hydrolase